MVSDTDVQPQESVGPDHWTKVVHYPAMKPEQRDGWGIECQVCDYGCGPFGSFEEADEYARKHEEKANA